MKKQFSPDYKAKVALEALKGTKSPSSYFVLEIRVSPSNEIGKGVSAFINAIRKQMVLPDLTAVRDKTLRDELVPLARTLDCAIKISPLKAIPQIRRDTRRLI